MMHSYLALDLISLEKATALKTAEPPTFDKIEIQREKYYKHRRKATDNQKKYLSIIIDGTDQQKCNLLVMARYSKD